MRRDEKFAAELYRGLANRRWRHRDSPGDAVALSWQRAERAVNQLREAEGDYAMTLAQTGGEGWLSDAVRDELADLGWTSEPLDTGAEQPEHATEEPLPPPRDQGERQAPTEPPREWREAQEAAERRRQAASSGWRGRPAPRPAPMLVVVTQRRTEAYGRVMRALADLSGTKLHPEEERVVRDAADELVLCRDFDAMSSAHDALAAVYELTDQLVENGRLSPERAQSLLEDVETCGPFDSGEQAAA